MSASHAHGNGITSNKMWVATAITFTFCLLEVLIGYKSNSLALMEDAGHNFADALALGLSVFALWVAC
jgi:cobalt-zinc-cadmium efflux system protein